MLLHCRPMSEIKTVDRPRSRRMPPLTGKQIEKLRLRKHWSQQHLADLLGVHRATVGRWESGEVEIPGPAQISARFILR